MPLKHSANSVLKKGDVLVLDGACAALSPPRPPSLREGGDPLKGVANPLEDRGVLMGDILVRESEHHDAAPAEESVAKSIPSLTTVKRRAVDLDREAGSDAEEVGEVRTDGKLASEQEAVELATT